MRNTITVRMADEMIAQIDALIAEQSGYVSRQEVVRHLVGRALAIEGGLPRAGKSAGGAARSVGEVQRAESDAAVPVQVG
ncbi:ribbon-helix-helix domain-containing protein [Mesorhizobium sp. M1406]|uniref:ribbon-helix-helix domain-containing protein n=1 Tax=Mesorhizobium sp. M1406 TaxID=2957099 RepID=UPI00333688D9